MSLTGANIASCSPSTVNYDIYN